jgi:hypothetical protein
MDDVRVSPWFRFIVYCVSFIVLSISFIVYS